MVVGRKYIDVTIELTFHEIESLSERRRIDSDGDCRITESEAGAYLSGLSDMLNGSVGMKVDGRSVDLITHFDPEIDLLGVGEVAPSHHLLRLRYFARTPEWLCSGSEVVLVNGLWPAVSTINLFEASGGDGIAVSVVQDADSYGDGTGFKDLRVECVEVQELVKAEFDGGGGVAVAAKASPVSGASRWVSGLMFGVLTVLVVVLFGVMKRSCSRRAAA